MGGVGVLLMTIAVVAGATYFPPVIFERSIFYGVRVFKLQMNESVIFKMYMDNEDNITPDKFADLVRFHNLYLKDNPIFYLTSPFTFLDDNFKGNKKVIVPSGFFSNMTKLKIVTLSECNLGSLAADVFSGSYSIKSLYLNRNYFKRFKENIFFDLEDLEVLDLSENNITHLPEKLFYRTKRLKILKIHNNLLVEIKQKLFSHLSELEYLDLRFNRIQEIKGEQFFELKSLRFLNISDNQLSSLALTTQLGDSGNYSVLQHCTNLEDLQLANNSLTEVYADWKMGLNRLRTLNLAFNNIQTVEIADFHSDVTTDVLYNDMKVSDLIKLPDPLFLVPIYLDRITFDNNPFVCDCRLLHFVLFVHKWMLFNTSGNLKCKEPKALENQSLTSLPLTSLTCRIDSNCPEHCTCEYRPIDKGNIVNCTGAGLQQVPPLLPLYRFANHTELILDYNRLTCFIILRNRGYENVTHFHLSNNNIKILDISGFSKKLKVLDVSHNSLTGLTPEVTSFLEHTPDLNLLLLHDNPWLCDSDIIPLVRLLRKKYKAVKLSQNVTCPDNNSLVTFEDIELSLGSGPIIICLVLVILSLLIALFTVLYYKYRTQIHIYCFSSKWKVLRWIVSHPDIDVDKIYDAFISYAEEDEPFIFQHLIPELEEIGETKFKLCIQFRDWKGGDYIPNQILNSVQNSRRTIVVLSPSFLKSVWGIVEFRAAHSEALKTGTSKVIVILKEEVSDITELEDELKPYLQMKTYIKWGSPWFWKQLKFALPHPPKDQDDIKCFFGCFPKFCKDCRCHNVLKNGEVTYVREMSKEKNRKDLKLSSFT